MLDERTINLEAQLMCNDLDILRLEIESKKAQIASQKAQMQALKIQTRIADIGLDKERISQELMGAVNKENIEMAFKGTKIAEAQEKVALSQLKVMEAEKEYLDAVLATRLIKKEEK